MSAAAASVNVQIGATFASGFKAAFGSAERMVGSLGSTVRTLDGKLQSVAGFRKLSEDTKQAGYAWQAAKAKADQLAQALAATANPTKKQAAELARAQKAAERAGEAFARNRQQLAEMRNGLTAAGISTANLADEQKTLEGQLQATTNRMKALAGLSNSGVGTAFANVGDKLRTLGLQAAAVGATFGFVLKGALDTASTFEKFATVLETTEGSAAAAQKSMAWITDFARTTPFGIEDTTAAFVKLRAYGLDPTNGLLRTLGDTSAAMGKDVMQAVEAIADAVTGEGERLKEFGVRGSKSGGQITYEYTDRTGKQASRTVDANNRAMIESTLTAIFNDRYAGAMEKLSNTWGGMVSRLSDEWDSFKLGVMRAGLFDWMKGQLGSVLATIDRMSANGELQAWAERTGKALKDFAVGAWELGSAIVSGTKALAEFVGGWKPLFGILAGIVFAPFILAVVQLGAALTTATGALLMFATGTATVGAALKAVGAILMANPIGIALTGLAIAGFMLWRNWSGVKGGMVAIWETIKETAISAFDSIKSAVGATIDWLAEKTAWIFQTVDKVKAAASSIGDGIGGVWSKARGWVTDSDSRAPAAQAVAPAVAVPAARAAGPVVTTNDNSQQHFHIQSTDPKGVSREVEAALARHRREQEAARRSVMIDRLGY